ncbi:site-specific integrase [Rhizobium sp. RMa-01]|uniref:site-specific integrase n=1 Tax=unclassified Rhizobium TaxID=2613769 RepID=UPI000FE02298|nr:MULTISPECIES: site-specific integrase [unclassified Rhizobium]RVU13472.1 site-specific integrase [Rhizobium sp. RMa-01]
MFNPAYLLKSRNGIFFFRWPIPKELHPSRTPTTIKLSLGTREPQKALRLSRYLSQIGQRLNDHGRATAMNYADIRTLLKRHFAEQLATRKSELDSHGPMEPAKLRNAQDKLVEVDRAIEQDVPLADWYGQDDSEELQAILAKHGVEMTTGTSGYTLLERAYRHAYRSALADLLQHDERLRNFNFTETSLPEAQQIVKGFTLAELREAYTKERNVGKNWAEKTAYEKSVHFALLEEILGSKKDARAISAGDAKTVKDTLLAYPKNRTKNPETRGKPLADILNLPRVAKLEPATLNKYFQTYNDFFEWAKDNNHIDSNLFAGLSVRQGKKSNDSKRDPYSDRDVGAILRAVILNPDGIVSKPYQKWATLIGIYTGARLGEISQLHLGDIRQESDIWYFDINDEGDRKSVKTHAAKRQVPIHNRLIEAGILEYVEALRSRKADKLFPDFTYDIKNGWGRQQSRWFNERLLVHLNLKTKTRVFHSLRHTVNTRLLQLNVPDPLVKAIIGHEPEGMTQKQYFKEGYTLAQRNEALQKLDFGWVD